MAVVGGLLTAMAFEPYGVIGALVVGPACLVPALQGRDLRASAGIGVVYGLAFQGILLVWVSESIGPLAWLALASLQALWFGAFAVVVSMLSGLPGAPFWFAVSWVGVESTRSAWPFGGLPWGRLGFGVVDTPWQGALPYAGVAGVSLGVALAAALLGRVMASPIRESCPRLVPLAICLGIGLVPLVVPFTVDATGSLTVAAVQGGVPGDGTRLGAYHREVTQRHVDATRRLAAQVAAGAEPQPDLVVWPENSTAVDPNVDAQARRGIRAAVAAIGAPVLVGGMVDGPTSQTVLNQGIVWTGNGPSARYTKHHPVPFGEYIPFRRLLGGLSPRLDEIPRDMLPGTSTLPLDVGGVPVADAICFDVAYGDALVEQVARGARLVVVQTSNATFSGTSQLGQQFEITRARAVETGRAIVVASTNGISGIIGPDGSVGEQAPVRTTQVLVADVQLGDTLTPAVRWGAWVGIMCILVTVVAAARASFYGVPRREPVSDSWSAVDEPDRRARYSL